MSIADTSLAEHVVDGVVTHRDLMVPMRDGVRLATDVYMPADAAGPFPVILERTPYGKAERSRSEIEIGMRQPMERSEVARYFVRHGFAVVYQDCRGRYGSEGEFVKYLAEGEDGFDTMTWLAAPPWCNGRVGTRGTPHPVPHTEKR